MDWLRDGFMRTALAGLLLIAPACGAMGVAVTHFRMAYFADAISHSAFTALALALILGLPPGPALMVMGVAMAWLVFWVRRRTRLPGDTVIGALSAGAVALGLVLAPRAASSGVFEPLLFGRDVLGMAPSDLGLLALLLAAVAAFQFHYFNDLLMTGIDRALAQSRGIPAGRLEWLFVTLLALTALAAMRFVGLLLVTALLVVPAAAARNLARSAAGLYWWSAAIASASSALGLAASFYLDAKTGPCVVLFCAAAFALSVLKRGRA